MNQEHDQKVEGLAWKERVSTVDEVVTHTSPSAASRAGTHGIAIPRDA